MRNTGPLSACLLTALASCTVGAGAYAQTLEPQLSGTVRFDVLHDTRQVSRVRDGFVALFPLPVRPTPDGGDGNAAANLLMTTLGTFLGLRSSTDAWGPTVAAQVEGDLFATADDGFTTVRLLTSYVRVSWTDTELVVGRYWSPLHLATSPRVLAYGAGLPFQPFAVGSQIGVEHARGPVRLRAVLWQNVDVFADPGLGPAAQHRSGLPGAHAQVSLQGGATSFGAGGYLRVLRPEEGKERVRTGAMSTWVTRSWPSGLDLRAHALYGWDVSDHVLLGGLADTPEGWVPLRTATSWVDVEVPLHRGRGSWTPGLFAGWAASLGSGVPSSDPTAAELHSIAYDLRRLVRVSPRIARTWGDARAVLEIEATRALYRSGPLDSRLLPRARSQDRPVWNVRTQLALLISW